MVTNDSGIKITPRTRVLPSHVIIYYVSLKNVGARSAYLPVCTLSEQLLGTIRIQHNLKIFWLYLQMQRQPRKRIAYGVYLQMPGQP
jgi:hypothetical protein